jgi:hypothetical protein
MGAEDVAKEHRKSAPGERDVVGSRSCGGLQHQETRDRSTTAPAKKVEFADRTAGIAIDERANLICAFGADIVRPL